MKKTKILTICMLVFAILLTCFNVQTLALTSTTKGKITVNNVEPGVNVQVYKLTTINYDDTYGQLNYPPYAWAGNIKTWLEGLTDATLKEYSDINKFSNASVSEEDAAKFYDALAEAIRSGTVTGLETKTGKATGTVSYPVATNGSAEITDLDMGTYLILIENGYYVYRPVAVNLTPVFNTTSNAWELTDQTKDGVVNLKASLPSIVKTVNDNETIIEATTTNVSVIIEAQIPTYPDNSKNTTYSISDELSTAFSTIDPANIKVEGIANEIATTLTKDNQYSFAETPMSHNGNASTWTINFDYSKIKQYSKIKISYQVQLNPDTTSNVLPAGENSATVYLDYSKNPYGTTNDLQVQSDTVTVNTLGLEVHKLDAMDRTFLAGAEFELSTDAAETNKIKFTKSSEGVYYQDTTATETTATTVVVGATDPQTGILKLLGLKDGTYYLKETKAPEGYNRRMDPVEIVIENGTTMKVEEITNNSNFQLPLTGGIGTTVFVASGIILIGLGVILLVVINRKKQQGK